MGRQVRRRSIVVCAASSDVPIDVSGETAVRRAGGSVSYRRGGG
jgi:hypothetical protein